MKSRSVLIVGDPWNTLDHPRDTSLYLARLAAEEFGVSVFWARLERFFYAENILFVTLDGQIEFGQSPTLLSAADAEHAVPVSRFHSIHLRTDPPVNLPITQAWNLVHATSAAKKPFWINPPHALLLWNEKLAPFFFENAGIETLVFNEFTAGQTAALKRLHAAGPVLVKPFSNAASRGVTVLDRNFENACETITRIRSEYGPWVIVQPVKEEILDVGEVRLFILDGQVAGALKKTAQKKTSSVIFNMDGKDAPLIQSTKPTPRQSTIAKKTAARMKKEKIYFASIDFIGDHVLEINITSTGLLPALDADLSPKTRVGFKYWDRLL